MTTTEAALRDALAEIADAHLGDQPAASGGSEYDWACRHIARLRGIAKRALSQPSPASSTAGEVKNWPPSEADWNAGLADIVEAFWSASTANYIRAGKLRPEDIKAKYALRDVILRLAPTLSPSSGEPAKEEPTAKGDRVAGLMRDYFEAHKKDKWDGFSADHLMGGLLNIVRREYRLVEPASVAVEAVLDAGNKLAAQVRSYSRGMSGLVDLGKVLNAWDKAAALSKPTPVEAGLREARDSLYQIVNMDSAELVKSPSFVKELVREALAALSETLPASSLGASACADRAFAPSASSPSVSPVPASIPSAGDRLTALHEAERSANELVSGMFAKHGSNRITVDEDEWNVQAGAFSRVDAARAELMPTEQDAINMMWQAVQRLKQLGWREAIYCPKDGSEFDAIEPGSTGIHKTHYSGEWPTGGWMVADGGDFWPSHPYLYRPTEKELADAEERRARFRAAIAIEARSGETGTGSTEGESAGRQASPGELS